MGLSSIEGTERNTSSLDGFMEQVRKRGDERVQMIHKLARRVWKERRLSPSELQNRCLEAWDDAGAALGTRMRPLVPIEEDRQATDLIFGSGSFTTGEFQAAQFRAVAKYAAKPPVVLRGLVANRSEANGCNAAGVSRRFHVPLVELDFAEWYHEYIDGDETNPIQATRYWYPPGDPGRPPLLELARRFDIRQRQFHAVLGEMIAESMGPTDIASARGYSFQFCGAMFRHQREKPHVNDTHPADLTYVDPGTKEKLYPGWQSSAVQLMMRDHHRTFRGSLIEVEYMDRVEQIDELDEGALLAIGEGVSPETDVTMKAREIQSAIKLVDDHVFCTLEPTGLLLAWGISEKPLQIEFQDIDGNPVMVNQRVIAVGDRVRSGVNAWGRDLKQDLGELERFLLG
jgi:hypothetical protein